MKNSRTSRKSLLKFTLSLIKAGYSENGAHVQASVLLKNPKVRQYLEELQKERRERVINKLAIYAETAVVELFQLAMSAQSESVRMQAMKDILDRSGYKPTDKVENKTDTNGHITFGFVDPSIEE
jgi:F0F1-type ATP synthase delta subunit